MGPHIFLFARARYFLFGSMYGVHQVVTLAPFFFGCARAVAAVPFLCARGAAVVWWIILRIWDIFLVACRARVWL